jgi:hypothetical protein
LGQETRSERPAGGLVTRNRCKGRCAAPVDAAPVRCAAMSLAVVREAQLLVLESFPRD